MSGQLLTNRRGSRSNLRLCSNNSPQLGFPPCRLPCSASAPPFGRTSVAVLLNWSTARHYGYPQNSFRQAKLPLPVHLHSTLTPSARHCPHSAHRTPRLAWRTGLPTSPRTSPPRSWCIYVRTPSANQCNRPTQARTEFFSVLQSISRLK